LKLQADGWYLGSDIIRHKPNPKMIKTITTLIMAASCMLARADDRFGFATQFDQQGASPNWNPDVVMPLIAATGAGWIRDDWNWKLNETSAGVYRVQPAKQHWLDMAAANGLKVVAVLQYPTSFYADPWDPQSAANFCAWTAKTEGSKIAAFEITNEPNNSYAATEGRDWKAKLVRLTNAVAKAVRAVSPQTLVIGYGAQGQQIIDMLGMGATLTEWFTTRTIQEILFLKPRTNLHIAITKRG
jgi:hypothetical protein